MYNLDFTNFSEQNKSSKFGIIYRIAYNEPTKEDLASPEGKFYIKFKNFYERIEPILHGRRPRFSNLTELMETLSETKSYFKFLDTSFLTHYLYAKASKDQIIDKKNQVTNEDLQMESDEIYESIVQTNNQLINLATDLIKEIDGEFSSNGIFTSLVITYFKRIHRYWQDNPTDELKNQIETEIEILYEKYPEFRNKKVLESSRPIIKPIVEAAPKHHEDKVEVIPTYEFVINGVSVILTLDTLQQQLISQKALDGDTIKRLKRSGTWENIVYIINLLTSTDNKGALKADIKTAIELNKSTMQSIDTPTDFGISFYPHGEKNKLTYFNFKKKNGGLAIEAMTGENVPIKLSVIEG